MRFPAHSHILKDTSHGFLVFVRSYHFFFFETQVFEKDDKDTCVERTENEPKYAKNHLTVNDIFLI